MENEQIVSSDENVDVDENLQNNVGDIVKDLKSQLDESNKKVREYELENSKNKATEIVRNRGLPIEVLDHFKGDFDNELNPFLDFMEGFKKKVIEEWTNNILRGKDIPKNPPYVKVVDKNSVKTPNMFEKAMNKFKR